MQHILKKVNPQNIDTIYSCIMDSKVAISLYDTKDSWMLAFLYDSELFSKLEVLREKFEIEAQCSNQSVTTKISKI